MSCRIGIVVFPGSNCDRDVALITKAHLQCPTRLIWHTETDLADCDLIVIPGGFSYGDYLRCGAIAHLSPVMQAIKAFADRGGYVLGICNGFQVLVEAGLLPGALIRNRDLHFICDWVELEVEVTQTPWTHHYHLHQIIRLPIAHGEGCYVCDAETLAQLQANDQIILRYRNQAPNGSLDRIAGLCNPTKTIMGLMPHPERAADPALNQIPATPNTDGLGLWSSILATIKTQQTVASLR